MFIGQTACDVVSYRQQENGTHMSEREMEIISISNDVSLEPLAIWRTVENRIATSKAPHGMGE